MESIFLDTDFSKCILESIYRSGSIEVRKLTSKISEIQKFSKSFQFLLILESPKKRNPKSTKNDLNCIEMTYVIFQLG